jgi:hypothetical protein
MLVSGVRRLGSHNGATSMTLTPRMLAWCSSGGGGGRGKAEAVTHATQQCYQCDPNTKDINMQWTQR